jgi:hypothetical protein
MFDNKVEPVRPVVTMKTGGIVMVNSLKALIGREQAGADLAAL